MIAGAGNPFDPQDFARLTLRHNELEEMMLRAPTAFLDWCRTLAGRRDVLRAQAIWARNEPDFDPEERRHNAGAAGELAVAVYCTPPLYSGVLFGASWQGC